MTVRLFDSNVFCVYRYIDKTIFDPNLEIVYILKQTIIQKSISNNSTLFDNYNQLSLKLRS